MSNRKLLGSFVLFVVPLISSVLAGQDTSSRIPSAVPVVDDVRPNIRVVRDQMYVSMLRQFPAPTAKDNDSLPIVTRVNGISLPELPIDISQTIGVGQVVRITPHMITGSNGIYSEYRVVMDSILMNRSAWSLTPLDVIEIGGSAQTADGRVSQHLLTGVGSQVEAGNSYIMFLKYHPAAQCFTFVKVWGLKDGRLAPVSDDDLSRFKIGKSTVAGRPQADVIDEIRGMVK